MPAHDTADRETCADNSGTEKYSEEDRINNVDVDRLHRPHTRERRDAFKGSHDRDGEDEEDTRHQAGPEHRDDVEN